MINIEEIKEEQLTSLLEYLQSKGWIKVLGGNNVALRKSGSSDIDLSWIDEYRELFKKIPGKMGDRKSCINKMQEFLTENKQYNKDIVMSAAEYYISNCKDYTYLMKADNFISVSKDNTKVGRRSELSVWCEEIISRGGKIEINSNEVEGI